MDAVSPSAAPKPPMWYWVVSALLFLWMCVGVLGLAMTNAETIAALPETQQQLYAMMPTWLWITYGLATVSGLVGALGLLLRKKWSTPVLALSFVSVCVQMGYSLLVMPTIELQGASAAVFPIVIAAIGAFAVWFSMMAKQRGVIAS